MGLTHFDEAPRQAARVGHLHGAWTDLGTTAGSLGVGLNRIEVQPGGWSTPVHEHGREEEIFYVLSGRGLSWQDGQTTEISAGDCIVYQAGGGAHTLHALQRLDVLAFGRRHHDEGPGFPRIGLSLLGNRAVATTAAAAEIPVQWLREAELGAPELPAEPGPRPDTIVNLEAVSPDSHRRQRVVRIRRNLGRTAGSKSSGLQHVEVAPGKESAPQHCHSLEEEIFVILTGGGHLVLDSEEIPVGPGNVVARPPATGVSHLFRAGEIALTYLAYGTREPADLCYYPRSRKIAFRGLGVIGRIEPLDYWDGED